MRMLKFYADWCGPCSVQSDILEDFDAVSVEPIDLESNEGEALATKYQVRSIPTLILMSDGAEVERFEGVTQLDTLEEAVDRNS